MKKAILLTSLFAFSVQASYKDFALYGLQGILNVSEQKKEYGAKAIGCGIVFVGSMALLKKINSNIERNITTQHDINTNCGNGNSPSSFISAFDPGSNWPAKFFMGLSALGATFFTCKFFKTK